MNSSDVLKLIEAGFTKDEIQAMDNPQIPQDNSQEKPTPVQTPETESENKPESISDEATNVNDSAVQIFQQSIKDMMESNKKLMETIQASNLQNDSHTVNSVDNIKTQAENALKSIIRPVKEDKTNVG